MELSLEVVYALAREQRVLRVRVPRGASLRQAIERSGLLNAYPEIDLARNRIGSFGRLRDPDEPAREGDRIEIYRPLVLDPRERRRHAARKGARARRDGR